MESDINISITNIWKSWQAFANGKRLSSELLNYKFNLEQNLLKLCYQLQKQTYKHGDYRNFVVHDPKRREIAVADIQDRVVHRLLYEYLVSKWDKSFCYDAWSCRRGKGLLGAMNRAQSHTHTYQHGWVWRSDITKFFDSVNHAKLKFILRTRTNDKFALWLLDEIIESYAVLASKQASKQASPISGHGLPIGNLTSQIFSNIYLNEFDQFVLHSLKPLGYVRYGDDFVLWFQTELEAKTAHIVGRQFLADELCLRVNLKHDVIQPAYKKLSYLGVDIWPNGHRLQPKVWRRLQNRLDNNNLASYQSLVEQHMPGRYKKSILHKTLDKNSASCYDVDYEN